MNEGEERGGTNIGRKAERSHVGARALGEAGRVRADAPNYFPSEELFQALQDKQRLQRIYRPSRDLLAFFNSQTQHEAVADDEEAAKAAGTPT